MKFYKWTYSCTDLTPVAHAISAWQFLAYELFCLFTLKNIQLASHTFTKRLCYLLFENAITINLLSSICSTIVKDSCSVSMRPTYIYYDYNIINGIFLQG